MAKEAEDWSDDLLHSLPLLLTRAQAAHVLGVSTKSIDRRIREKAFTAVRFGRRTLIPRGSLVRFLLDTRSK